ncbi:NADP-dependent oxidoreductase [Rhodococcus koreensis]|uniref:NADPH2:quinone reductase n=1 Tax=Rhodococcus koreensis TaxID=99653 RepID=A0A1H5B032_9NOCA|nr:NADP-dependent oxidoreductase [Rhodococcus koreensis]QSE78639.1 NADP-dependent oxidoreductase [Rhodococcus koreensis]SED47481.1 NADPH2:quinone reductase [Rhodococcus koreensis]
MRRVVARAYGGPEVLALVDAEPAGPAPGEVVIEVRAIGVNPIDYKLYSGAFGADPAVLPMRLGSEAAGVVAEVGDSATGPRGPIAVGDEVIAYPLSEAYADRLVVSGDSVVPKPASLPWNEAAGLLAVGATAVDTLDTANVGTGDLLLVHGAAGGVGSFVVQLARARGATIIGTARPGNHDYVRSLGATPVSYGDGLSDRIRVLAPDGVDAVIDTAGSDEAVDVSVDLVRDRSRLVTTVPGTRAGEAGFRIVGALGPEGMELRKRFRAALVDLAGNGDVRVRVARTYALSEAARAHADLRKPHAAGKFILLP